MRRPLPLLVLALSACGASDAPPVDAGADHVALPDLAPPPPDLELPLRDPTAHPTPDPVVDNGGRVIAQVHAVTVCWANDPLCPARAQFASWLVGSDYFDPLAEYQVQRGTADGPYYISSPPPAKLDDSGVGPLLRAQIAQGALPAPTADTLYLLYLDPSTTSTLFGSQGCVDYGAYHWYATSGVSDPPHLVYAVMPACVSGAGQLDSDTVDASHEIVEAVTDPEGNGWNDDPLPETEIADLCTPLDLVYDVVSDGGAASYRVSRYWSQKSATSGVADPCVPTPPAPYVWFNAGLDPAELPVTVPNTGSTVVTMKVEPFALGSVGRIDWEVVSGPAPGLEISPLKGSGLPGSTQLLTITVLPTIDPGPHAIIVRSTAKGYANVWTAFLLPN